ncbi:hypothetical protein BC829DRAFT_402843 [Chytridium lagenaria]|nr:hypothetical protein BC829DRAFT_402843 [Chytridium lagenaria]
MASIKAFNGPRSERFSKLPPLGDATAHVGPGAYDIDQITTLSKSLADKPSSKLGVCVTTAQRFPDLKELAPSPDKYEPRGFVSVLKSKITSTREPLETLEDKNVIEIFLRRMDPIPGPGTYDINRAIGRHVGNDYKFGLLKSDHLRKRDAKNKEQVHELKKLLATNDLFTDKRACRRMAHLALYHP